MFLRDATARVESVLGQDWGAVVTVSADALDGLDGLEVSDVELSRCAVVWRSPLRLLHPWRRTVAAGSIPAPGGRGTCALWSGLLSWPIGWILWFTNGIDHGGIC